MSNQYNPKYKKQEKSREKFEKVKTEIQEKFEKEHTFQPQINYAFSTGVKEKFNESKDEIYRRLSKPKIVEINKRLREKSVQDAKKLAEQCTFKPNADKPRELSADREKVSNRLYKLAEQMKEKREKLKQEYHESQQQFPYKPEIDETSKQLVLKYEQKPIYERVIIFSKI
jgi:hypothetical protein